jgi:hypothetical protein
MRYQELIEGVTTPPKNTLGPVFVHGSSTDLNPNLVKSINDGVKEIKDKFPQLEILDILIIGSSVSYQWDERGDIDVSVIISPIPDRLFSKIDRFTINELNPRYHFGKSPVEFKITQKQDISNTDAAYDVLKSQWIKKPDSFDTFMKFAQSEYDPELKRKVELLKNTIDSSLVRVKQLVSTLLQQSPDQAGNIHIDENDLKIIQHSKKLITAVKNYRRQVFNTSHPDPTWSDQNLVFKKLSTGLFTQKYIDNILPMLNSIIYSKGIVSLSKLQDLNKMLRSGDELLDLANMVYNKIYRRR